MPDPIENFPHHFLAIPTEDLLSKLFKEKLLLYHSGSDAALAHYRELPLKNGLFIFCNQDDIALQSTGQVILDGKVDISGETGISGNVDVKGNITVSGKTGLSDGLNVSGGANISGDVNVEGNITATGDIFLSNADFAEDFDLLEPHCDPGTVMVLAQDGALTESTHAYDKKVAGILSGAGNFKPGIILDRHSERKDRKPLAMMGKVFCKVDADAEPIEVGDLLTTSNIKGHAMKAVDSQKAFGTVIGKALQPLSSGKGMIAVLVSLQ